jgi:uncharacterized Zn-binding protein involved in type VI secretion
VVATDIHIEMIPTPGGPVPTPLPHPFAGLLDGALVDTVLIEGQSAAVVGSTATNTPSHVFMAGPFQRPPSNQAKVMLGSPQVLIGGAMAARHGDPALTCNDPADLPVGTVMATGTVLIGP